MTADWPFVRGDAASTGATSDAGPREAPDVLWTHDAGRRVFGTPLVDDERVYVATTAQLHHDNDPVVAIDRETGDRDWMGCPDAEEVRGTPALGDDVLVVGDLDGRLFVLDPTDGTVLGKDGDVSLAPADGVCPILDDDVAFVPSNRVELQARTVPGLGKRWSRTDGHTYEAAAALADGALVLASTRSTGAETFVGTDDGGAPSFVVGHEGYVGAFAPETGGELWREQVRGLPKSVAVHDGTVVTGTSASDPPGRRISRVRSLSDEQPVPDEEPVDYEGFGVVAVHDLASGAVVWRTRLEDPVRSMVAVDDAGVCVGTTAGDVVALEGDTGAVQWRSRVNADYQCWSSPTIADDTVYVGSEDDAAVALDRTDGRELWRFETTAPISGNASVVDGVCYVADDAGTVYALA